MLREILRMLSFIPAHIEEKNNRKLLKEKPWHSNLKLKRKNVTKRVQELGRA